MKIAFVYPEYESLGIEYLSAVLKQHGHETKVFFDPILFQDSYFDMGGLARLFDYKKHIVGRIAQYGPDLVAFSVLTDFYGWAKGLSRQIKTRMDVPVVFGGIHSTAVPDYVLQEKSVDYVIIGEGEYPMLELVNAIQSKNIYPQIDNIWYRKGGLIQKTKIRHLIEDLDSLPFPDKDIFYREVCNSLDYIITTGRGCPYSCSYCHNSFTKKLYSGLGKYLRRRSPENVIEELEIGLKKYRMHSVTFQDELFTYDKKWLSEFSILYQSKIRLPSFCCVDPVSIDSQTVGFLRDINCYAVEMGVQSLDARIREDVLGRKYTNNDVALALKLLRRSGIECVTDHILGLPTEGPDSYTELLEFYRKNKANHVSVFLLRYYPNTDIISKSGLKNDDIDMINKGESFNRFTVCGNAGKEEVVAAKEVLMLLNLLPINLVKFCVLRRRYSLLLFFAKIYKVFLCANIFRFINRLIRWRKLIVPYHINAFRYLKYPLERIKISVMGLKKAGRI